MRSLVPARRPARPVRQAAVQRGDQIPRNAITTAPMGGLGTDERRYNERYQTWQRWARRYTHSVDAARFVASVTSDLCARADLRIERREGRKWVPADLPDEQRLDDALDEYRSERQDCAELVRFHAWHYQVAGECVQTVATPQSGGTSWGIWSTQSTDWDRPNPGMVTVKTMPGGNLRNGTAFALPRNQVFRFWIPDEEWQAYATSPMVASINALHRIDALARMTLRTSRSRAVMNGWLWTPGEAHEAMNTGEDDGEAIDNPISQLDRSMMEAGRRSFDDHDDESVESVMPLGLHWGKEWGPPKSGDFGYGLDEHGIQYKDDALNDFGRGVNVPGTWLQAGGPGGANHWGDWLADQKFVEGACVPTLDRITHQDLTATFLRPVLHELGLFNPADYRIGYDVSNIVVPPDQSELALKYHLAGLLKGERAMELANLSPDDRMDDEEFAKVLDLLSRGRAEATATGEQPPITLISSQDTGTAPSGSSTVVKGAPAAGPSGVATPTAVPRAAALASPRDKANKTLRRLSEVRQRLGRRLLDSAEVAFTEAIRKAGSTVQGKAYARGVRAEVKGQVAAAITAQRPLAPYFAAVGVTEASILEHAFDSYDATARRWMLQSREQQRQAVRDAGLDPADFDLDRDDEIVEAATGTLVAGLIALARQRLTDGPLAPASGEVSGHVPATIVRGAVNVLWGRHEVTHAETPDAHPTLSSTGTGLEELVAAALSDEGDVTQYVWRWGYYGDPTTPFEPHQDLGYSEFTTTDPEGDPDLGADVADWTDSDLNQPGDHPGCTCEWETVVEGGPGPGATIGRMGEGETPADTALVDAEV